MTTHTRRPFGYLAALLLTIAAALMASMLRGQPPLPPIACTAWVQIAGTHTEDQAARALAGYDPASVYACTEQRYGVNWGAHIVMHTEHKPALKCLLGREPTLLEYLDSQSGRKAVEGVGTTGTATILKARREKPECYGSATTGHRLECLIDQLSSISAGSRLYDRLEAGTWPVVAREKAAAVACGYAPPGAPQPTPTPVPSATPQPTATPCPSPKPCPDCPACPNCPPPLPVCTPLEPPADLMACINLVPPRGPARRIERVTWKDVLPCAKAIEWLQAWRPCTEEPQP